PSAHTTWSAWPAPGHRPGPSRRTTPRPAAAATAAGPPRTRYIRHRAHGSSPAASPDRMVHNHYRRAAPHLVAPRGNIHLLIPAPRPRPGERAPRPAARPARLVLPAAERVLSVRLPAEPPVRRRGHFPATCPGLSGRHGARCLLDGGRGPPW